MQLLNGVVQAYDWGDPSAIANLLGYPPPGNPEAEYWLGAHPKAPSLLDGSPLDDVIAADPKRLLGPEVAERFGQLPFLLKILAAGEPLSIQAHPSLSQAAAGFAREDEAGIDRGAPNRNYRDANHKPELICALTNFEAKCGFRDLATTRALVDRLLASTGGSSQRVHLMALRSALEAAGGDADVIAATVAWLLRLPTEQAAELVAEVVEAAGAVLSDGNGDAGPFGTEFEWVAKIDASFPGDIGVVVSLLLNHVTLEPGQAVFLSAGNLHCYLSGVGVELMANSDNVLRGGMTSKHVDVDELLSVVTWVPSAPPVQTPESAVHRFDAPVPEFSLTRVSGEVEFVVSGPEIVLCTAGSATLISEATGPDGQPISKGDAVFVGNDEGAYRVADMREGAALWRAAVP